LKTSNPSASPGFFYGHVVVSVSFLIMLLSWGMYIVFGVFFDPLLAEFHWTRATISGAYALSSILSGVLGIAVGTLTDRFGPRLVVTVCGFFLGLGYILMSQITSLWHFYVFYGVVIGIGMAGLWIPLISPIVRWFDKGRSLMTGIVISGLTIGQLIAPILISRLIAAQGWRMSYIILGGAIMVIIIILAQFLRNKPGSADRQPETSVKKQDTGNDLKLKEAVLTPQFWLMAIILFCVGYAAFSVTVHLVPHAIKTGISDVTAATILAVNGGVGIIGNFVLGGFLGEKLGNRRAFIIGFFICALSLFWLAFTSDSSIMVWAIFLFAVVFGIGIGGTGTSESPLLARLFGPSSHGTIYGVVGLSWTVGGALGPILTGYLCDVLGNYQIAFLVCAILAIAGVAVLLVLRPTKKRPVPL